MRVVVISQGHLGLILSISSPFVQISPALQISAHRFLSFRGLKLYLRSYFFFETLSYNFCLSSAFTVRTLYSRDILSQGSPYQSAVNMSIHNIICNESILNRLLLKIRTLWVTLPTIVTRLHTKTRFGTLWHKKKHADKLRRTLSLDLIIYNPFPVISLNNWYLCSNYLLLQYFSTS